MTYPADFDPGTSDPRDPDPWLALYVDKSIPIDPQAKLDVTGTILATSLELSGASAITLEGATADEHETTLTVVDPTADVAIKIPKEGGTMVVQASGDYLSIDTDTGDITLIHSSLVQASGGVNQFVDGKKTFTGDMYLNGAKLGVGVASPTKEVEVDGHVTATQFCIGGDCLDAWPSGGGSSLWTESSGDVSRAVPNSPK